MSDGPSISRRTLALMSGGRLWPSDITLRSAAAKKAVKHKTTVGDL